MGSSKSKVEEEASKTAVIEDEAGDYQLFWAGLVLLIAAIVYWCNNCKQLDIALIETFDHWFTKNVHRISEWLRCRFLHKKRGKDESTVNADKKEKKQKMEKDKDESRMKADSTSQDFCSTKNNKEESAVIQLCRNLCNMNIETQKLREQGDFMGAIRKYQQLCNLYCSSTEGLEAGAGFVKCVEGIIDTTHEFCSGKEINDNIWSAVKSQILPVFDDLKLNVRKMKGITDALRISFEAKRLYSIGFIYLMLNDYGNCVKECKKGLRILETKVQQFQECNEISLVSLAGAYQRLGHFAEAKTCFSRAMQSLPHAIDLKSEADRDKWMASAENQLAMLDGMSDKLIPVKR